MLDDFFVRALLAAIGLSLIAAPAGCVLLWQRSSYFGETIAHSALLGAALGLFWSLPLEATVFATALLVAVALYAIRKYSSLTADSALGVLAPSTLALGLVFAAAGADRHRYDLNALLFGDVLAIQESDLWVIGAAAAAGVAFLCWIWRPLVASILHPELAEAEGMHPQRRRLVFTVVVAAVVAVGVKVVGVLLIVALMLIPAATARSIAQTPEQMAVRSAGIGIAASVLGLHTSLSWDIPAGPAIVLCALGLFLASLVFVRLRSRLHG